ncbi:hypothetical protein MBLNU459_g8307t2 [Dothideomycetes sp. NU459]
MQLPSGVNQKLESYLNRLSIIPGYQSSVTSSALQAKAPTCTSQLYANSSAAQRSPIATLNVAGQEMHLVHPLDSASIKAFTSMRHLSLMTVFHVAVGPAMGLVSASEKSLTDPDAGVFKRDLSKLFNGELRSLQNLRKYASQLEQSIDAHLDQTFLMADSEARVKLGAWLFDLLSHSMGAVFWGEEGPFEDELFRVQLRLFIQNLEALRNPFTWFIPAELRSARKHVRETVDQCVRADAYGKQSSQEITLFRQLASLYESLDIPREAFTDCHLIAIVGLMSNVINMITWAFCHVVADPELMACLRTELSDVINESSSPDLTVGIDRIRDSCPLLVATWYELLRTYGDSPVARAVSEDCLFDDKYRLRKGSFIMTPIHLHNFDEVIWGEDAKDFRPRRFIRDDGRIEKDFVKRLNVFGLPGMHQCPGRYLGHNVTLGVLAKALLGFEITAAPGDSLGNGQVPRQKDTMLGLPVMNRDPEVIVKRRRGIRAVRITFDHAKPGW